MHRPQSWSTPFPQERLFWDGLDSYYLFDFADRLSSIGTYELGFRPSGTKAGHRAADLILAEMYALGLEDVHKEAFPVYAWAFAGASLELDGWEPLDASSFPPTPGTSDRGIRAPLVDAGYGTARDYLGIDVQGKIAFVRFDTERLPWMDVLAHEAELRGARALVFYYLNGYAQHESGEALNTHDGAARPTIPILQLPIRDGVQVAERLTAEGPVLTTLRSHVETDPQGTGYNVIGHMPGRLADRYLIIGAHYDAWFHGYWDNAVGVAGILTLARALLKNGYQPEHTLLFIATDAEEFGAPDTHFDWLIGCHRLLEAHPEWHRRVSAAFNIDTLSFLTQEELGFIGPPELVPFLREAAGRYQAKSFPQPRVWVKEQVTAWTETLTYAYFGVPPIQPRFGAEEIKRTIYHTQFDTAAMVHHERAAETLQLYGALLVRFDRQPILPYDFTQRVRTLRTTIGNPPAEETAEEELDSLRRALDEMDRRAERLNASLARMDGEGILNDLLCQVAAHLISHINYVDATAPEDALPLHVFYNRDLRALDTALDRLTAGEARGAIAALTHGKTGLHGARFALNMSYPVYHRNALAGRNPGRDDLFWGQDRTPMITDMWGELQSLQDKLARGVTDFGAEAYALQEKRETVAASYRDALRQLTDIIKEAAAMLHLPDYQDGG